MFYSKKWFQSFGFPGDSNFFNYPIAGQKFQMPIGGFAHFSF
jgi:hypothetical protein